MDDVPATLKPRRRWKRWAALTLVLTIGCGVWMVTGESETIRRSRNLRLGQTEAEVNAIMGEPYIEGFSRDGTLRMFTYKSAAEQRLTDFQYAVYRWFKRLGLPTDHLISYDPVQVNFVNGRVSYIRRGSEIVEAQSTTP